MADTDLADIANWRESVQRDAKRLLSTIESNAPRMNAAEVFDVRFKIESALRDIDCALPT